MYLTCVSQALLLTVYRPLIRGRTIIRGFVGVLLSASTDYIFALAMLGSFFGFSYWSFLLNGTGSLKNPGTNSRYTIQSPKKDWTTVWIVGYRNSWIACVVASAIFSIRGLMTLLR